MPVTRLNPSTLPSPILDLYSQVAIGSGRIVAIAGQVAFGPDGDLVGVGDLAVQAEQAFRNLKLALEAAGGTPADLLKYTIHVVDHRPEKIEPIFTAGRRVFGDEWPLSASTLIGVAALGLPDWLIEIDALAVVDTHVT